MSEGNLFLADSGKRISILHLVNEAIYVSFGGEFKISDTSWFTSKVKNNLLPVLLGIVILNAILSALGIIPSRYMWYFVYVAASVELAFFLILIFKLTKVIRQYRLLKNSGLDGFVSLRRALEVAIPSFAAKWVVLELRLYYTLIKSFLSKKDMNREGIYLNKLDNYRLLFNVIIALCILEIALVALFLPSKWITWKIVHFVIGVWAIAFLAGDYNAMRVNANELIQGGIRLQMGLRCCQDFKWEEIMSGNKVSKSGSNSSFGPEMPEDEPGTLYITAGENCNVAIDFKEPQIIQGMIKDFRNVSRVYLSLEKPEDFVNELDKEMTSVRLGK